MNCELNNVPCVATVGFFDGVHVGHRFLVDELCSLAQARGIPSLIVTFRTHPRKVLQDNFQPRLLTLFDEKMRYIEQLGASKCIVLDFDLAMSQLSAFEFLKQILKEQLNVQTLLVGHDHRFGKNRAEGFDDYHRHGVQLGIEVIQAKRYLTPDDSNISSSVIRERLLAGDLQAANRMLGYPYSFTGKVIPGFQKGREIGFPTANLEIENSEKVLPARGVYAARSWVDDVAYKAMINIGTRPTLNNGIHTTLEVHLLDFNRDIYYRQIKVEFLKKIRDEKKFESVDKLIQQLTDDREQVAAM